MDRVVEAEGRKQPRNQPECYESEGERGNGSERTGLVRLTPATPGDYQCDDPDEQVDDAICDVATAGKPSQWGDIFRIPGRRLHRICHAASLRTQDRG